MISSFLSWHLRVITLLCRSMVSLALYQPDIPQNLGAALRLSACLGIDLHVIEPCGFPLNERKIRQSGMDYIDQAKLLRHESWPAFQKEMKDRRIVLMTTKSDISYTGFDFEKDDVLLAGRESAGVPQEIHDMLAHRVTIPMKGQARSLNIINASAMVAGEAMRQTGDF